MSSEFPRIRSFFPRFCQFPIFVQNFLMHLAGGVHSLRGATREDRHEDINRLFKQSSHREELCPKKSFPKKP